MSKGDFLVEMDSEVINQKCSFCRKQFIIIICSDVTTINDRSTKWILAFDSPNRYVTNAANTVQSYTSMCCTML